MAASAIEFLITTHLLFLKKVASSSLFSNKNSSSWTLCCRAKRLGEQTNDQQTSWRSFKVTISPAFT